MRPYGRRLRHAAVTGGRLWRPALCFALALGLGACSSSQKLSHRDKGDRAYAKRDWPQAIQEYQLYVEEGSAQGDAMLAQYMLARAYFENQDYPTAAVEFEIFQRDYPRSDSLEAAAYYEALSWVKQSPRYDRDSSITEKALRMLDGFIQDHPQSAYLPWAVEQRRILDDKLARKDLEIARFYQRIRRPEAAVLYYEKLLREQPDSASWAEGFLGLLDLRLDAGQREEAARLVEELASRQPDSELTRRAREKLARNP